MAITTERSQTHEIDKWHFDKDSKRETDRLGVVWQILKTNTTRVSVKVARELTTLGASCTPTTSNNL